MDLTVQAPMPNARMSVMLVTVTLTPACSMVSPTLSARGSPALLESLTRLYQHAMITNMSSIPIPLINQNMNKNMNLSKVLITNRDEGENVMSLIVFESEHKRES